MYCYIVTNHKETFSYIASWQPVQNQAFNLSDNQVSLFALHIYYAIFNTQKKQQ